MKLDFHDNKKKLLFGEAKLGNLKFIMKRLGIMFRCVLHIYKVYIKCKIAHFAKFVTKVYNPIGE